MRASEITLAQVERAYERHGLVPSAWAASAVNGKCCALGALAFDVLGRSALSLYYAAEALGIDQDEGASFAVGFDRGFEGFIGESCSAAPACLRGHEIGKALRSWKAPQVSS